MKIKISTPDGQSADFDEILIKDLLIKSFTSASTKRTDTVFRITLDRKWFGHLTSIDKQIHPIIHLEVTPSNG